MYWNFIVNGKIQLVLKPETETERELFKGLFSNGVIEVVPVNGNLNILETSVSEGIIIRHASEKEENL